MGPRTANSRAFRPSEATGPEQYCRRGSKEEQRPSLHTKIIRSTIYSQFLNNYIITMIIIIIMLMIKVMIMIIIIIIIIITIIIIIIIINIIIIVIMIMIIIMI